MNYSTQEVIQFVQEEDVKFVRLAFCDVFGVQKNISIMPSELKRAFSYGIAIDASAINGFGSVVHSDLLLHPDPDTLTVLPWRPEHGRVVRMFCDITYPDGKIFDGDTRNLLKKAVKEAKEAGFSFNFGSELEFYLFKLDENGNRTQIPYDNAGYMDIAPDDKGENIRREICLTLEQMGILPESSHHEEGPGQNEIDFRYSDPVTAADNAITFKAVVKTIASRNGLYADFCPKPISNAPGSGLHINMSVGEGKNAEFMPHLIAGVLDRVQECTLFFNPTESSYSRLGNNKAPKYVTWSSENRSQLIRIPAAIGEYTRAELRSPDPMANPYIAFALLIYAGLEGIQNNTPLQSPTDINLYTASKYITDNLSCLPMTLNESRKIANDSDFVKKHIPQLVLNAYLNN